MSPTPRPAKRPLPVKARVGICCDISINYPHGPQTTEQTLKRDLSLDHLSGMIVKCHSLMDLPSCHLYSRENARGHTLGVKAALFCTTLIREPLFRYCSDHRTSVIPVLARYSARMAVA